MTFPPDTFANWWKLLLASVGSGMMRYIARLWSLGLFKLAGPLSPRTYYSSLRGSRPGRELWFGGFRKPSLGWSSQETGSLPVRRPGSRPRPCAPPPTAAACMRLPVSGLGFRPPLGAAPASPIASRRRAAQRSGCSETCIPRGSAD